MSKFLFAPVGKLNDILSVWSKDKNVFCPIEKGDRAVFEKWDESKTVSDRTNTVVSPKNFFFPQSENLMEFKTQGKNIELVDLNDDDTPFVIFGIRACDVKSFDVLDNVFLAEPKDTYYAKKRENCTIVSLCCTRPAATCFCQTFSIDPTDADGDVTSWKTDDKIIFRANTEKGEKLLDMIDFLVECDDDEIVAQREKTKNVLSRLPLASLTTEKFGAGQTNELFDNKNWDTLSESCLGCGTCTFVCPTCQCYDIRDFKTNKGVVRYRCWDSCMYSDFTLMAAGQPRQTQKERFRQRFMHKLVYYPENNDGMFSCVGCGRCVAKCPVSLNIAKVMKTIQNDEEGQKDE